MIFRAYALENPGVWGWPQVHTARRPRAQTGIQKLHFLNRHLPLTNTFAFPETRARGARSKHVVAYFSRRCQRRVIDPRPSHDLELLQESRLSGDSPRNENGAWPTWIAS